MQKGDYSTTAASRKLQSDLGVDYGLGKKVVSEFFNYHTYNIYGHIDIIHGSWTKKSNYEELVENNIIPVTPPNLSEGHKKTMK